MLAAKILAAVLVVLAGLGLHAVTGALAVPIVVVALCWIITDESRSRRLAMLIEAWRGRGRLR
jgi:cytochrome b